MLLLAFNVCEKTKKKNSEPDVDRVKLLSILKMRHVENLSILLNLVNSDVE